MAQILNHIYEGEALEILKTLPSDSINCCITSPPYYGLRDYGTASWEGGDPNCDHKPKFKKSVSATVGNDVKDIGKLYYQDVCKKCGAIRVDKQIGIEHTPEEYVQKLVEVFREVKRVLRPDGTLWLNLGDSYAGGGRGKYAKEGTIQYNAIKSGVEYGEPTGKLKGYKPKDMIGIPWMTAFALRADGWYLRQDLIWHKPACMPESVTDRCTKSHEYIFLFSKSQKYYFDYESIQEKSIWFESDNRSKTGPTTGGKSLTGQYAINRSGAYQKTGMRNKRDVWSINLEPNPEAHFAMFPRKLVEPMVKAGCPKGGIVLDPFAGGNTTGIVARKLDRNFISIELNPEYVKLGNERTKQKLGIFL